MRQLFLFFVFLLPVCAFPQLTLVQPLSETELQLRYKNPVYIGDANFLIPDIGKAIRMIYSDEGRATVNIRFDTALKPGTEYLLHCKDLKDFSGNTIPDEIFPIMLEYIENPDEPDQPSLLSGAVQINEIMADPNGLISFPETEYVELRNTTNEPIQLHGWLFQYGGSSTILPAYSLPSGGYVVIYRSGRNIHIDFPGKGLPLDKFPSALANAGKELALRDATGSLIDAIAYQKAKPGVSWERSDKGLYLSTDNRGGTPGSANSNPDNKPEPPILPGDTDILSKEIVFNELLPNPSFEGSEYIELYNRSGRSLSLTRLSIAIRKSDGTLSTRYPLSSLSQAIPSEGYALLTRDIDGITPFYLISSPNALYELRLPALANTSATLVLFRTQDETIIDEVHYSSKWHAPSIKDEKGVSLERINPDRDSQDASNWTSASATSGYGTPGYRNSQYGSENNGATGIESPVFSELNGAYSIAYYLDQPGYTCRAKIFDTAGRETSEIANLELLGAQGELTWNGLTAKGSQARAGMYILYVELSHPNGQIKQYKKVFVVR